MVFDGAGGDGVIADVLVRDGRVAGLGIDLTAPPCAEMLDAAGLWVTPGFIDCQTLNDAEVAAAGGQDALDRGNLRRRAGDPMVGKGVQV